MAGPPLAMSAARRHLLAGALLLVLLLAPALWQARAQQVWRASSVRPASVASSELNLAHLGLDELPAGERLCAGAWNLVSLANNRIARLRNDDPFACLAGSLRILNLAHNRIETLPSDVFASLAAIQVLLLDHNLLGRAPEQAALRSLRSLRHLNLAHNRIHTLEPASFGPELARLISLDLSGNPLHRISSSAFVHLARLKTLTLSQGRLSGELAPLRGLFELRFVHLDRQLAPGLESISSDFCADSRKVSSLVLKSNQFARAPQFALCRSLLLLDLSYNYIAGELEARAFGQLPNLIDLYLGHNQLESLHEEAFWGLARLQVLDLSDNRLVRLPAGLFLPSAGSLYELNVAHNSRLEQLPGAGLQRLVSLKAFGCPKLRHLPKLEGVRVLALTYAYHCCEYQSAAASAAAAGGPLAAAAAGREQRSLALSLLAGLLTRLQPGAGGAAAGAPLEWASRDAEDQATNLSELVLWPRIETAPDGPTSAVHEERRGGASGWAWPGVRHASIVDELVTGLRRVRRAHSVAELGAPAAQVAPDALDGLAEATWDDAGRVAGRLQRLQRAAGPDPDLDSDRADNRNHHDDSQRKRHRKRHLDPQRAHDGAWAGVSCAPKPNAFLPCQDLFDSWWLRVGIWIVFLLSFVGNILVIAVLGFVRPSSSSSALTSITWLSHSKRRIEVPRFLVINLAFADLLMSIYLGILALVDASTLGEFKFHAIRWQYSNGCQLAGFLAVLSSELSVFILAIITLERNYAITNAVHLNKRLSLPKAVCIMLFGYAFALLMALMPLNGINDYRKFSICLPLDLDSPPDCLAAGDCLSGAQRHHQLVVLANSSSTATQTTVQAQPMELAKLIEPNNNNNSNSLANNYGYSFNNNNSHLGANSLSSQIYIISLLAINTLSFTLLLSCYLRMYFAIRGSQAWSTNDLRIAKRMSILVITDFLCWMPIIVAALSSLLGYDLIGVQGVKTITIFILPLNSVANPFLYAITAKKFKRELNTLLVRCARLLPASLARWCCCWCCCCGLCQPAELAKVGQGDARHEAPFNHKDPLGKYVLASAGRHLASAHHQRHLHHHQPHHHQGRSQLATERQLAPIRQRTVDCGALIEREPSAFEPQDDLRLGHPDRAKRAGEAARRRQLFVATRTQTANQVTMNRTTWCSCQRYDADDARPPARKLAEHPRILLDSSEVRDRAEQSQLITDEERGSPSLGRPSRSARGAVLVTIGAPERGARTGLLRVEPSLVKNITSPASKLASSPSASIGHEPDGPCLMAHDWQLNRSASACGYANKPAPEDKSNLGNSHEAMSASCGTVRPHKASPSRSINRLLFEPIAKAWSSIQISIGSSVNTSGLPACTQPGSRPGSPKRALGRGSRPTWSRGSGGPPEGCCPIHHSATVDNLRSLHEEPRETASHVLSSSEFVPTDPWQAQERRMSRSCDTIPHPLNGAQANFSTTEQSSSQTGEYDDDQRILLRTVKRMAAVRGRAGHSGRRFERQAHELSSSRTLNAVHRCRSWSPALLSKLEDCIHHIRARIPGFGSGSRSGVSEAIQNIESSDEQKDSVSITVQEPTSMRSRPGNGRQDMMMMRADDEMALSARCAQDNNRLNQGEDTDEDIAEMGNPIETMDAQQEHSEGLSDHDTFDEAMHLGQEWSRGLATRRGRYTRARALGVQRQSSVNSDTLSTRTAGTVLTNMSVSFDSSTSIPAAVQRPAEHSSEDENGDDGTGDGKN